MTHTNILRTAVAVELVAFLLGSYVDYAYQSPLIRQQYAWPTASILMLVGYCIGLGGIWFFQGWARVFYTILLVADLVAGLFREPSAAQAQPLATMFFSISTMADGMILGLIWFSDLRERFARTRNP